MFLVRFFLFNLYLAGQKFVGEFSRHLEKCTDFSLERQLSKKQVECYIDKDYQECVEKGSENNGKKNSFHDTCSGIITEEFVIFTNNKILVLYTFGESFHFREESTHLARGIVWKGERERNDLCPKFSFVQENHNVGNSPNTVTF